MYFQITVFEDFHFNLFCDVKHLYY